MARAIFRPISRHFLSPFQHSYTSSLINDLSLSHKILTFLNSRFLKKTQLKEVFAQLIISGRLKIPYFGSKFLRLSSQVSDLRCTLWVFYHIDFPDIVCYNTLIKGYSCSCVPFHGVKLYFEMIKSGVFPNSFTFPPLFGCCAKIGEFRLSEMCHGQVIRNGFDNVMQIKNSMIHMYACCGLIEVALKVFDDMIERDLVSWNSILDGFVKVGDLKSAYNVFDVMPERNVVTWNILMTGYLEGYNPGCVLKLFREMIRSGLRGNDTTIVNVLAACGRSARRREGASVHGFLVRRLWNLSLVMNSALIDMYSKCLKVGVAQSVFDGLLERNLVCWNSMILGHCLHGNPEDGLQLFEDMKYWMDVDNEAVAHDYVHVGARQRVLPDEITFIAVLCACTRAGLLEEGKTFWHEMTDSFGLKPNFAHYWCMANLLASKGLVQEALKFVRKVEFVVDMPSESLLWASLLGSCRFQGDSSMAEHVAKALIDLEPQNVMCYALLLNIYAAGGRWEDVPVVKELMKTRTNSNLRGCSLVDLIDIVHNFRLEDETWHAPVIVDMVDRLSQKFGLLDTHLVLPSSVPKA